MLNDPNPDTAQSSNTAKTTPSATKSKKSTPAARSTAKPTSKPRVKTAAKSVAKRVVKAPSKVTAKHSIKRVPDQKAAKKGQAPKADKNTKPKKAKLVRDSFTMPEHEYGLIAIVKKRCVEKGLAVKKSDVLRAAIISFAAFSDSSVMEAIQTLEAIKTGRPPKGQK